MRNQILAGYRQTATEPGWYICAASDRRGDYLCFNVLHRDRRLETPPTLEGTIWGPFADQNAVRDGLSTLALFLRGAIAEDINVADRFSFVRGYIYGNDGVPRYPLTLPMTGWKARWDSGEIRRVKPMLRFRVPDLLAVPQKLEGAPA